MITPLDARFAAAPQLGFASPGNRISKQSTSKDITEAGVAPLTAAQYEAILNAKSLAVQTVGLKRSATYERADSAPKFLENLRESYQQKVR